MTTLILPGLGNSGPEHWQSYWEREDPACVRVQQAEWDRPRCEDWVQTLDVAVAAAGGSMVLVAHSSACALIAHWAGVAAPPQRSRVRGALLVAPSDPEGPSFPAGPTGFAPMPLARLPFASIVVASTNDEYLDIATAEAYAKAWGSRFANVGALGHVNAASGLGMWPQGRRLLDELRLPRE